MGLKYAARAGGRGRAKCAGRAEPAHGRGSRGLCPLQVGEDLSYCKLSAASEAKQRTAGDAEHPFDDGMTTQDMQKPVKDSTRLR